jgi:GTP-binding protein
VKVLAAGFEKTSTRRGEWPPGDLPELAFVGRSNVGKSSMLNALAQRRGLARVSRTPGRTQALQFFKLEVARTRESRPVPLRFCDLPGYGYAKVPRAEQDRWAAMIEEYLAGREALRAVVLIVDARRDPTDADREALAFLRAQGRPVVVAATKIDKLAKSHRHGATRAAEKALALPLGDVVPFSAVEGMGSEALWERLFRIATATTG